MVEPPDYDGTRLKRLINLNLDGMSEEEKIDEMYEAVEEMIGLIQDVQHDRDRLEAVFGRRSRIYALLTGHPDCGKQPEEKIEDVLKLVNSKFRSRRDFMKRLYGHLTEEQLRAVKTSLSYNTENNWLIDLEEIKKVLEK